MNHLHSSERFAGLRPVSHKIKWESPAGAAILTILVTKRRFPNGLYAILSKITGICENTLRSKRKELLNPKNIRPIHSYVEHKRKPKIPPDLQKMMVAEIIEQLPTMPRLQTIQSFCVSFLQRPENLKKFLRYQDRFGNMNSTTTNLIECIEDLFTTELTSSKNEEEVKGYERLLIPQALFIFGLNRFSFSLITGRATKIRYPVTIPDAITINEKAFHGSHDIFVELQLYAVIVHKGQSPDSGHYYAYLKPDPNGDWYCFNDSNVSNVGISFLQTDDVLRDAYLVCYKNALYT